MKENNLTFWVSFTLSISHISKKCADKK